MSNSALLLLLSAVSAAPDCPASLVLNVEGLSAQHAALARGYAHCVGLPWMPVDGAERKEKLAQCANKRPSNADEKLAKALNWVDHISETLPACETRLEIRTR